MVEEQNQKNLGVWETAAGSGKAGEMATGDGGVGTQVTGVGQLENQNIVQDGEEEPEHEDQELLDTAEEHEETAKIKMEIDAKTQLIQAKLSREVELTAAEEAIVTAVHGVFDKYDLNKDGVLSDDEVRPFFINFNQLVIGMSAEIAHDDQTIDDSIEGAVMGAPGGKQYYSTIT